MASLVPELYCSDVNLSRGFYTGVLGFNVKYERPEDGFAYLEREGAELMLDSGRAWLIGSMEYPFGRGINFQIQVSDIEALHRSVREAGHKIYLDLETKWYRIGDRHCGNRQFIVLDPDGYMLRFYQDMGSKP